MPQSTVELIPEQMPPFGEVPGFLARYSGKTRVVYALGRKTYFSWCAARGVEVFAITRPHLELWVRWMEEDRGYAEAVHGGRFPIRPRRRWEVLVRTEPNITLTLQDGRRRYRVKTEGTPDSSGHRRQVVATFDRLAEARAYLERTRAKVAGSYVPQSERTWLRTL